MKNQNNIQHEIDYKGRKRRYRFWLSSFLVLSVMMLFGIWVYDMYGQIPGNIKLKLGEEQVMDIGLPIAGEITQQSVNASTGTVYVDFSKSVTMKAEKPQNYQMDLKLFGWIPFKRVNIEVIHDEMLTPVGLPIGIYLKTEGVLVIDVGSFEAIDGREVSPARNILNKGDYITKIDNIPVTGKKDFIKTVEASDGNPLVLTIKRSEETIILRVTPEITKAGAFKLGIWVRDSAQGVGTMTYVDGEGNFGALGHGINDVDTSMVMELLSGTLYQTEIVGIKKGKKGEPGEMTGMIRYTDDNILGTIESNSEKGIFGNCNKSMLSQIETEPVPIGLKQEVELGDAEILCTVDGKPRYYNVEIVELHLEHDNVNKGIVLRIKDENLIKITGGIIQGMSGAPILQNGKLIGAVTHVLVNDSTSGYGIFIEHMLEKK